MYMYRHTKIDIMFVKLCASNNMHSYEGGTILSVNEKLPVSKFRYFGKYIMQLFGYCYVHVSGQRQADLER